MMVTCQALLPHNALLHCPHSSSTVGFAAVLTLLHINSNQRSFISMTKRTFTLLKQVSKYNKNRVKRGNSMEEEHHCVNRAMAHVVHYVGICM